jgi:SARP family transcriptional regulator, regulator of embCAB operon
VHRFIRGPEAIPPATNHPQFPEPPAQPLTRGEEATGGPATDGEPARQFRYRLLGQVSVATPTGPPTVLTGLKVGQLAAVLLARANYAVPAASIAQELWEQLAPRRAQASLHVHVSQLRRLLGQPARTPEPLLTVPSGYLLRVRPGELDLHYYLDLLQRSRALADAGDPSGAARMLSAAQVLAGSVHPAPLGSGPILSALADTLGELRRECTERCAQDEQSRQYEESSSRRCVPR